MPENTSHLRVLRGGDGPPYSEASERQLLACALVRPEAAQAIAELGAEVFYLRTHQSVAKAIIELLADERAHDAIAVGELLRAWGDESIDARTLTTWIKDSPSLQHEAVARTVAKDKWLRVTIQESERAGAAAMAGDHGAIAKHVERMESAAKRAGQHIDTFDFVSAQLDLNQKLEKIQEVAPGIYEGRMTQLISEPGLGKSWLALVWSLYVMDHGGSVIYLDEEGGIEFVHERLRALGADAAVIRDRFHYFPFPGRKWELEDIVAMERMLDQVDRPQLAVIDSLANFLATAGVDENSPGEVLQFISRICGPMRHRGIAQLILDHIPKPESGKKRAPGRYARGASSKLGTTDTSLLLDVKTMFDAHTSGTLKLWKTKDRYGQLNVPYQGASEPMLIEVTVKDGSVAFQLGAPNKTYSPSRCITQVEELLVNNAGCRYSITELHKVMVSMGLNYKDTTIGTAAYSLAREKRIAVEGNTRKKFYYDDGTVPTFDDDESEPF